MSNYRPNAAEILIALVLLAWGLAAVLVWDTKVEPRAKRLHVEVRGE